MSFEAKSLALFWCHLYAMLFNKALLLGTIMKRLTKGTFLHIYLEIWHTFINIRFKKKNVILPHFWCYLAAIFCRGTQGTFLTNYIGIWQADSEKNLKVWKFCPLFDDAAKLSMEFKSLNNFERGPPKEQSCEVWLKLVLWFRRRWCL